MYDPLLVADWRIWYPNNTLWPKIRVKEETIYKYYYNEKQLKEILANN